MVPIRESSIVNNLIFYSFCPLWLLSQPDGVLENLCGAVTALCEFKSGSGPDRTNQPPPPGKAQQHQGQESMAGIH